MKVRLFFVHCFCFFFGELWLNCVFRLQADTVVSNVWYAIDAFGSVHLIRLIYIDGFGAVSNASQTHKVTKVYAHISRRPSTTAGHQINFFLFIRTRLR